MKKLYLLLIIVTLIISSCGSKGSKKQVNSNIIRQSFMSNGEKIEYILSEDSTLNFLSDAVTNECVKYYGKCEFNISTLRIINVDVNDNKAKVYMQFLFSGYNTKDDFFLRQASSECQVAVIEADIIDNGDETLTLTNPKTIAISKNDNEYHGIVKDEFPQKKQVDALKDIKETLSDLMTSQASSVEDYLSSINKAGMPYGDYETYYAIRKK